MSARCCLRSIRDRSAAEFTDQPVPRATPAINPPIAPGATAKLKVQYNAAAVGAFNKDVYIKLAGVETPKNIKISGEVLEQDAYTEWVKQHPVQTPIITKPEPTKTTKSKTKTKSGS